MGHFEKLDVMLGRLVFRTMGLVCLVVALICSYAAYANVRNESLIPTVLFSLAALAAASTVPYCFSRKRTFAEALDAMEGGAGDQLRTPRS